MRKDMHAGMYICVCRTTTAECVASCRYILLQGPRYVQLLFPRIPRKVHSSSTPAPACCDEVKRAVQESGRSPPTKRLDFAFRLWGFHGVGRRRVSSFSAQGFTVVGFTVAGTLRSPGKDAQEPAFAGL